MKVKVTRDFFDKTDNLKLREAGTWLTVTNSRGKQLVDLGLAEAVKEPAKMPEAK